MTLLVVRQVEMFTDLLHALGLHPQCLRFLGNSSS